MPSKVCDLVYYLLFYAGSQRQAQEKLSQRGVWPDDGRRSKGLEFTGHNDLGPALVYSSSAAGLPLEPLPQQGRHWPSSAIRAAVLLDSPDKPKNQKTRKPDNLGEPGSEPGAS